MPFCNPYLFFIMTTANSHLLFFFFLMIGRPPRSPLFPSTTLFRSRVRGLPRAPHPAAARQSGGAQVPRGGGQLPRGRAGGAAHEHPHARIRGGHGHSEREIGRAHV